MHTYVPITFSLTCPAQSQMVWTGGTISMYLPGLWSPHTHRRRHVQVAQNIWAENHCRCSLKCVCGGGGGGGFNLVRWLAEM